MCGIFGVLSYKNKLKDMDELVNSLAEESAERGTDATGIAYVSSGKIKINKHHQNHKYQKKKKNNYKLKQNNKKFKRK